MADNRFRSKAYAINSDPKHLPTAVLVQDNGQFSRYVIGPLERSDYFCIRYSARFPAETDGLVERGSVQFPVTIPGDFTRRVVRKDNPQILVEADASDPAATGGAVAALPKLPSCVLVHDLEGISFQSGPMDKGRASIGC